MLIVLDNMDSFTYNLVQMFRLCRRDVRVYRNNFLAAEEILAMKPEGIVLSPGPGRPADAGIMPQLIRLAFQEKIPLLGICLGHQGIAEYFGAEIVPAKKIMHGKTSWMFHSGTGLFSGIPNPFRVVRYHSLAVREETLPPELEVTCRSEDGEIMGLQHKNGLTQGVQYHPESVLSEFGMQQINHFCLQL